MRDNRRGLFDDMVFYIHITGDDYKGQGKLQEQIHEEILNRGGRITYKPSNESITHILVPPDKELKERNWDYCSLVKLYTKKFHKIKNQKNQVKNQTLNIEEIKTQSSISCQGQKIENQNNLLSKEFQLILNGFYENLEGSLKENLKEILQFDQKLIEKEQIDWDIPRLIETYSECLNEKNEIIQIMIKPVLRFHWILRCIEVNSILQGGNDEKAWGGQLLRGHVLNTPRSKIPRLSNFIQGPPIQDIPMSGQSRSQAHLDFARSMNSGNSHNSSYTAMISPKTGSQAQTTPRPVNTSYQPRPKFEMTSSTEYVYKRPTWAPDYNPQPKPPSRPLGPDYSTQKISSLNTSAPIKPSSGKSEVSIDDLFGDASPKPSSDTLTLRSNEIPIEKVQRVTSSPTLVIEKPVNSDSSNHMDLPPTPSSSQDSVLQDNTPDVKPSIPNNTHKPIDPRKSRKRVIMSPVDEGDTDQTPTKSHAGQNSGQSDIERSVHQQDRTVANAVMFSPEVVSKDAPCNPKANTPHREMTSHRNDFKRPKIERSPIQDKFIRTEALAVSDQAMLPPSTVPAGPDRVQSHIIQRVDTSNLFKIQGIPMTFWVYGDNFTVEFCIKSGGGIVFPNADIAQILIIPRMNSTTNAILTKDEDEILTQIEARGSWQKVLSSRWIEDCLKNSQFLGYDEYEITKIPVSANTVIPDLAIIAPWGLSYIDTQEIMIAKEPVIKNLAMEEQAESDDESVICIGESRKSSPQEIKPKITQAFARKKPSSPYMSKEVNNQQTERVQVIPSSSNKNAEKRKRTKSIDIEPSKKKQKDTRPAFISKSKIQGLRNSQSTTEEVDENIILLVRNMRKWIPQECSRTCFLNEFKHKYNHKDWVSFFKRHRSRILIKFKEMGYIYPGDDDFDEIDHDHEASDGSVYEP
ncbi:uncharacterized protein I206_106261 [Kwoniella pini CBS 10737]|uniref:BRCT domain-containing protein n=1 Tax=Kwoniella pini CBS 10737 TaxID=1296096 RepID=A0A1B9I1J5_9TREE|nr:uncharacterized protein I206_05087 [Kwoniella pini CBS 10737]OCF49394.1 hypothetical protein I206_05087 [Kwoniella pini CBS 10737]